MCWSDMLMFSVRGLQQGFEDTLHTSCIAAATPACFLVDLLCRVAGHILLQAVTFCNNIYIY